MKNVLLTCLMAASASISHAQIKLAPIVGTHFTQGVLYTEGKNYGTINRSKDLNVHAGAVADIRLGDRFSFQPAILFQNNGFERPVWATSAENAKQIPLYTAEGHAALAYKLHSGKDGNFFFGLDEFIALNLKPYSITYTENSTKTTTVITTLKRPYLGMMAYAGYEFEGGLFARIAYQRVLSNIYSIRSNAAIPNLAVVYYNYGITAGYFIKARPKKQATGTRQG